MNGVPVPAFDFELPGVQLDERRFAQIWLCGEGRVDGLVPVRRAVLSYMPFDMKEWSGAPMKTPTLGGDAPGRGHLSGLGGDESSWALRDIRRLQGQVCATRERVQDGVKRLGFEVLGNPMLGLIAFRHPDHHAFAIYGEIYRRGWFTSVTKQPPSLHLMLSPKHADFH